MAKPPQPFDVAVEHAKRLPVHADQNAATVAFFEMRTTISERLREIVNAGGGPPIEPTLGGLRGLELWIHALPPGRMAELGTGRSELNFLMAWHSAGIAVRCVPHTSWIVEESPFLTGHWMAAIRSGLSTQILPIQSDEDDPARTSRRKRAPYFDRLRQMLERVGRDPTLHPDVLANRHRLSREAGIRHCQVLTLARGVDAFDEAALVGAFARSSRARRLEILRCLEALPTIGEPAVEMLRAAARRAGAWQEFTIGLLIRHCTTEGLDLARWRMDSLSEYSMGPIIRAIRSVPGLAATDVLATAVRRISVRRHPLWQEGESFALAVQRLWEFAQAGDETAQLALRDCFRTVVRST